jgi:hypothetical protein
MAVLAALSVSARVLAQPAGATGTHCRTDERVQFSCQIGSKTVSLCAEGKTGAITSLAYRYGLRGKIENEFVARPDNSNRFFGSVSPVHPGASVSQIWFDRGHVRYLLTECVGGRCPHGAGLAVLRGDRVLMNGHCVNSAENDLAWFSRDLVTFGSDAAGSRSATELLRIEDADNELDKIYQVKAKDTQ